MSWWVVCTLYHINRIFHINHIMCVQKQLMRSYFPIIIIGEVLMHSLQYWCSPFRRILLPASRQRIMRKYTKYDTISIYILTPHHLQWNPYWNQTEVHYSSLTEKGSHIQQHQNVSTYPWLWISCLENKKGNQSFKEQSTITVICVTWIDVFSASQYIQNESPNWPGLSTSCLTEVCT